jgi:hypothetical protein
VIHERGITPDSIVNLSQEEEEALFYKRFLGGFESLDEAQKAKMNEIRDVQLDRAMDYLKSQLIYGDRASRLQRGDVQVTAQREE